MSEKQKNILFLAVSAARGLPPSTQLVLVHLASHAKNISGYTWVGQQRLADEAGLSRRRVVDAMAMLESLGLITRQRRYNAEDGSRKQDGTTLIRDVLTARANALDADSAQRRAALDADSAHRRAAKVHKSTGLSADSAQHELQRELLRSTKANSKGKVKSGTAQLSASNKKILFDAELGLTGVTDQDREQWANAYPLVNVDAALVDMKTWLLKFPKKRKRNGYPRFINGWLANAQRKAERAPRAQKKSGVERLLAMADDF